MLCGLCRSGLGGGPAGHCAGGDRRVQAGDGGVSRPDRAGLHRRRHRQERCRRQDQRHADGGGGRLLQGQPRGAAPAVRAGRPHDDPDLELRQRPGRLQRQGESPLRLALPARCGAWPDRKGSGLFGRDGAAAHDRGREPPVRQRLLGHRPAQHPALCGQPLQLPGAGAPLPQPDRRDDPGHGRAGLHRGAELLHRLPGRPARPGGLPQHGGSHCAARGPLQAGGRRGHDRPGQRLRRHRRAAGAGQLRQNAPAGRRAAQGRLH